MNELIHHHFLAGNILTDKTYSYDVICVIPTRASVDYDEYSILRLLRAKCFQLYFDIFIFFTCMSEGMQCLKTVCELVIFWTKKRKHIYTTNKATAMAKIRSSRKYKEDIDQDEKDSYYADHLVLKLT